MNKIAKIVAGLALFAAQAQANITDGKPAKISAGEKSQIEQQVCRANFNLNAKKVEAFKFRELEASNSNDIPAERTLAFVECEPHAQFNNKDMRYIDDCDLVDGLWSCSKPQLEVLVDINGREVKMRPWGITPEKAYTTLKAVSKAGFFLGLSLDKAIGTSCDVSKKPKDPDEIEVSCNNTIQVSYWCPQAKTTGCPRILSISMEPIALRRSNERRAILQL